MIDPWNGKSVWLFENLLSYLGNKIIFSWDDLERSYNYLHESVFVLYIEESKIWFLNFLLNFKLITNYFY